MNRKRGVWGGVAQIGGHTRGITRQCIFPRPHGASRLLRRFDVSGDFEGALGNMGKSIRRVGVGKVGGRAFLFLRSGVLAVRIDPEFALHG